MAKKKKPAPSSRGFATTSVQSKAQTQTKDQAETEPDSEAGADVAVPVLSQELEAEAVQEAETSANDNETNALLPVFSTVKAKVDAETASASAILSRSVGDSVPWLRLDSATENSIFQALAKAGFGQKWDVLETSTDPGSPSPSSLRDFSILLHARLSLEAIGFSSQHAEQALTQIVQVNLGGSILKNALDWLCFNLDAEELPPKYTDKVAMNADSSFSMVAAKTTNEVEMSSRHTIVDPPYILPIKPPTSKALHDDLKSRILQAAAYDSDEDLNENSNANLTLIDSLDSNTLHALFTSHLEQLRNIITDSCRPAGIPPPSVILDAIKQYSSRIKTVESDRAFQRRKSEVEYARVLKATSMKLSKGDEFFDPEFDALLGRVHMALDNAKSKMKSSSPLVLNRSLAAKDLPAESGSEDEVEFGGLFDQSVTSTPAPPTQTASILLLHLYVPQSWSGHLPKRQLQDNCAKLTRKGCTVKILYSPIPAPLSGHFRARVSIEGINVPAHLNQPARDRVEFETPEDVAVHDRKAAEEHVATVALWRIFGSSVPVYRTLPPAFRDVWVAMEEEERRGFEDAERRHALERIEFCMCLSKKWEEAMLTRSKGMKKIEGPRIVQNDMEERSGKLSDAKQNSTSIAAFEEFDGRKRKASYLDLKRFRGDLPVSSMKSEIVELVQRHQVVIISGETGSGKSTQIPQFLLEAAIEGKNAGNTNIVCTQPRRISATSIASRVSEEMGDPQAFGKGAFVGYSVRLDSRVGPSTRLTFQTTGVLLRRLEQDPMLNGVSHVIVDEVHERSLDSDFLLLNLRRLLLHRRDLRIVLMSATADSAKFATYFESALEGLYCPVLTVPGRTFPVEAFFLEDAVEACGYEIDTGSEFAVRERYGKKVVGRVGVSGKRGNRDTLLLEVEDDENRAGAYHGDDSGRYHPNTLHTLKKMDLNKIDLDLVEMLIRKIVRDAGEGESVLVFLPGLGEIRKLHDRMTSQGIKENLDTRMVVLPLHSVLSGAEQSVVFKPVAKGLRKVVLSTNIAETGVTIPDVVYVVDTCRAREVSYDEKRNLTRLGDVFISQANCRQRRGRAGRVKAGICYHLILADDFDCLQLHRPPEMLRLPLEELVLRVLASAPLSKDSLNVREFLAQAPDPPPERNTERAIMVLKQIQALSEGERLTPLGRQLANLPVDVRLGKMLLYGVMLECLDPVLTIAAALSLGKDPFATQFGESGSVGAKKFKNGDSDLATMANAYSEWRNHICKNAREKGSGWNAAREFAVENGLNFTDLNMIEEARMQLLRVLGSGGVLDWDGRADNPPRPLLATVPAKANRNGTNQSIVLAALAAGIYPSVAVFTPLPAASNRAAGSVPILHLQNGSSDKIDVHSKSVVGKEGLTPGSWYGMYSMTKSGDRIIAWDLNCLGRVCLATVARGCTAEHRTRLIKADGDKVKMCCVPKTATLLSLFASRVNAVFDRCLAQMGQSKNVIDQLCVQDKELLKCWMRVIEGEYKKPSCFQ